MEKERRARDAIRIHDLNNRPPVNTFYLLIVIIDEQSPKKQCPQSQA